MVMGQHYLCARHALQLRAAARPDHWYQMEGHASARPGHAEASPSGDYQIGSTSSRMMSSIVWHLRMSATLSPRTSASAGKGREL
jgi:hypothetical protein